MTNSLFIQKNSRHWKPVLLLTILIVGANIVALSGAYHDDPMLYASGLGTGLERGLWPGRPNWYDPTIGFVIQALGKSIADSWLSGTIPWWNPYAGVGMPQIAELQNQALFLPFVLLLHFHMGWLFERLSLQILSAIFTYFLAIQLNLTRLSGVIAGILYGCMGADILIAHAPVATFVFTPLLLLGIEHLRAAVITSDPMGWSMIAIAITGSFYAGFPETAFFGNLLGCCWFSVRLLGLKREVAWLFIGKYGLAIGIGLALTLPGLVPFLQYMLLGTLGAHNSVYATAHLPLTALAIEFLPLLFGPLGSVPIGSHPLQANAVVRSLYYAWGDMGGWIGPLPLLFACAGALGRSAPKRSLTYLLLGWFVFWQLRIFGAPGLTNLLAIMPVFHLIDLSRFAEPSCDFAIILLAAFAIDQWQRGDRPNITGIGCLAGALLGVAVIFAIPTIKALNQQLPVFVKLAWVYGVPVFAMLIFALWILSHAPRMTWQIGLALLFCFDTVGGFAISQAAGSPTGQLDTASISYLSAHIGLQRVFSLGPLAPNYGAAFGIAEIDYNMLPIPRLWTVFVSSHLDHYADPVVFNGNYEGRPTGSPTEASELRKNLFYYELAGVKYVLASPGQNPFLGMSAAASPPLVFRDAAMDIYQLAAPKSYFSTDVAGCSIDAGSRLDVAIDCPKPAKLERLELMYPGWQVRVNGLAEQIRQTDQIFQSVDVPKGASRLLFYYWPPHELIALLVSGLAGCVWIGLVIGACRRRQSVVAGLMNS